jgi:hypothetical protein
MFIKVDPNNSVPPDFQVIDSNATLAGLLATQVYNDCSVGLGRMHLPGAVLKTSQDVTCNNLAVNPLTTDIYEA